MIVDEGDPYSELLVNKSINKLKGRNIFGKVEQKILPGSSEDLKVLEISVEEKATGEIMAGAGVGTDGTSFQFAIKVKIIGWEEVLNFNSSLNLTEDKSKW